MQLFRHLEIIQALATHRSFSRAAKSLGMSQSVLSRTLALIESELGFQLFERNSAITKPTALGEIMIANCGAALHGISAALREIRLIQGLEAGSLIVSTASFPSEISVCPAIGLLAAKHPKLNILLFTRFYMNARHDVLDGRADIAVADISGLQEKSHSDLDIHPLSARPVSFICRANHPLLGRTSIGLNDVFSFPFVGPAWPRRARTHMPKDISGAGSFDDETGEFIPKIQVDTAQTALAIIQSGDSITIAHRSQFGEGLANKSLSVIPIHQEWMHLNYGFITKKGRTPSPAMLEFKSIVTEIERSIA